MAADPNLFQQYLVPTKSVMDYSNDMDKREMNQLQLVGQRRANDLANITVQQQQEAARQGLAKQNALQSVFNNPAASDPIARENLLLGNPLTVSEGQAMQTARLNAGKIGADTSKSQADAGKTNFETAMSRKADHLKQLVTVSDVPGAVSWINDAVKSGELPEQQAGQVIQALQSGQMPFSQWRQKAMMGGLTSQEQLNMTAPKVEYQKAGDRLVPVNSNAYAEGGVGVVPGATPIKVGVSPDTVATQAGENSRAAASRQTQLQIAGLDQNGNFVGGANGIGGLVDALGQYKVPEGTALARVPPAMKAQIMAQLADKYPNYDPTQLAVFQKASKDFATGAQGQQVQAANTALNHLDTIKQLAQAQKNGDYQLVNKLFNAIGAQTGNAAPTNMQAAVQMVAPEITKAVVGAGGGVGERGDFAKSLNGNFAPDQLLGVTNTMQDLLGGRLSETQRTYQRTTGRKDFADTFLSPAAQTVLASRQASPAAGAAIGATPVDPIAAELARRGHK